jgi:hypothetical protein
MLRNPNLKHDFEIDPLSNVATTHAATTTLYQHKGDISIKYLFQCKVTPISQYDPRKLNAMSLVIGKAKAIAEEHERE